MITFRIFEIFRTSEFRIHNKWTFPELVLWLKVSYLPSCWDGDGLCCWQASKCYERDRNKAHFIPLWVETTNGKILNLDGGKCCLQPSVFACKFMNLKFRTLWHFAGIHCPAHHQGKDILCLPLENRWKKISCSLSLHDLNWEACLQARCENVLWQEPQRTEWSSPCPVSVVVEEAGVTSCTSFDTPRHIVCVNHKEIHVTRWDLRVSCRSLRNPEFHGFSCGLCCNPSSNAW